MDTRFTSLLAASRQSVSYMLRGIAHICHSIPPRAPGSAGEREAAEYMADTLKKECGCTDVRTESFPEHPSAFYGYFYFSMVFDVLCGLCFFLSPWLSILFGCAALFLFLTQFLLYKQIIDPLFPRKNGTNVTAVRPCSGECRRRVFFNAHIDAAWEFPLNYLFGGVVFEIPGVMALLGVLFYIVLSVFELCGAQTWVGPASLWGLLFMPFFLLVGWTYNPHRVVDGANDNLSGCYMGISLLYEMEQLGITLDNTELGVILTGSEEAGLRGAKVWSAVHRNDYADVPTYILSFDTIHDPRFLMVNGRDLNGTTAADPELCKVFLRAAEEADVPCRMGWVPPFGGSTDSAAFIQGGFRSACVTGLNHKLEDYYHTRRDTCDNLNTEGLENCYRATVCFLAAADRGDLD